LITSRYVTDQNGDYSYEWGLLYLTQLKYEYEKKLNEEIKFLPQKTASVQETHMMIYKPISQDEYVSCPNTTMSLNYPRCPFKYLTIYGDQANFIITTSYQVHNNEYNKNSLKENHTYAISRKQTVCTFEGTHLRGQISITNLIITIKYILQINFPHKIKD